MQSHGLPHTCLTVPLAQYFLLIENTFHIMLTRKKIFPFSIELVMEDNTSVLCTSTLPSSFLFFSTDS